MFCFTASYDFTVKFFFFGLKIGNFFFIVMLNITLKDWIRSL